jgi:hypothetical protein
MKNKGGYILFSLGIISGFLSNFWGNSENYGWVVPGLLFGIVIAIWFLFVRKNIASNLKIFAFIIISIVAFYAALYLTVSSLSFLSFGSLFLGGFVGGLILIVAFHILFFRLNPKQLLTMAFLGGFLGLFGSWIIISPQNNGLSWPYILLFIVWQSGMAYALGGVMNENIRQT